MPDQGVYNSNNNNPQHDDVESLDIYKTNKLYKAKQKIRWMTPKRKLSLFILPLLVVALGVSIYFALAGPDDPAMRMVDLVTGQSINGQTWVCGQTYSVAIKTDTDPTLHPNQQDLGIVQADSYMYYDSNIFSSASIDSSSSAYDGVIEEAVVPGSNLVKVIRSASGGGLTTEDETLAIVDFTVGNSLPTSQTTLRFYDTQKGDAANVDSSFTNAEILDVLDVNYNQDNSNGDYTINLECNIQEANLSLSPETDTVNKGDNLAVNLDMWSGEQDLQNMTIRIDLATPGILDYVDTTFNSDVVPVGNGSAVVVATDPATGFATALEVRITGYNNITGSNTVNLATLNFSTESTGTTDLVFNPVTEIMTGSGNNIYKTGTGGTYTVTIPTIRDCNGTSLSVTPTHNSVDFTWCTKPASNCRVDVFDAVDQISYPRQTDANKRNHHFIFNGLTSENTHRYDIVCSKPNYIDYTADGLFTTLKVDDLIVSNVKVSGITAHEATISWITSKGVNGNGLSDSQVRGDIFKEDSSLVASHNIKLVGLGAETEYTFYVESSVNGDRCAVNTATPYCAASNNTFTFKTLAANTSPDANLILKVDRDRECGEWLYCNASVEMLNNKKNPPIKEDVCFSVGVCNELSEDGKQCIGVVDSNVGATTKDSPDGVGEIKNLSGYSKVGLDWGGRCTNTGLSCTVGNDSQCGSGNTAKCVDARIDGYYPYSTMREIGLPVGIANANFEISGIRPWAAHNGAKISINADIINRANKVLRIDPAGPVSGAIAVGLDDKVNATKDYVISFQARTDSPNGQKVWVELGPYGGQYYKFKYYNPSTNSDTDEIVLTNSMQQFIMRLSGSVLDKNVTDQLNIAIVQASDEISNNSFYIDNINMKSVLEVGDSLQSIARSCRLYPTQNAAACDYYDAQQGRDYRGWKGYCVEADPIYENRQYTSQPVCLQWWPVDIISGESNIFSDDIAIGYADRSPLYYCLESPGDFPYYSKQVQGEGMILTPSTKRGILSYDMSPYEIYKDEIALVEIKGVQIDRNGTSFNDCDVVAAKVGGFEDSQSYPQNGKEQRGVLIFNQANKQYWNRGFGDNYTRGSDVTTDAGNKYIALRCDDGTDKKKETIASGSMVFNSQTDLLEQIQFSFVDEYKDVGSARFDSINITYQGERCNVITQVVTPDGENKAWTKRVSDGGWQDNNVLGYQYDDDYRPYGASVVPAPVYDPTLWNTPLFVEPANRSVGMQKPFQTRAGLPYSYSDSRVNKTYCIDNGPKDGQPCVSDNQCNFITYGSCDFVKRFTGDDGDYLCSNYQESCDPRNDISGGGNTDCPDLNSYFDGQCGVATVGEAQCISGSKESLGAQCNSNSDCGFGQGGSGVCVGANLDSQVVSNLGGGAVAGVERLKQLWAKSYGSWEWAWDAEKGRMAYIPTTTLVWDISNKGVVPRVENLLINNSDTEDLEIISQGVAVMKFTSWASPDQLPIVKYTVDWGDGTKVSESGLRIRGKDLSNPHILAHYYKYKEGPDCTETGGVFNVEASACSYKPTVQIEDNWGRCNETGDCGASSAKRVFAKEVIVYKELGVSGIPPNAPSELNAAAIAGDPISSVRLTWKDNSSIENGFRIERSVDGLSGWTIVANVAANTTSYVDNKLVSPYTFYNSGSCDCSQSKSLPAAAYRQPSLKDKILGWMTKIFGVEDVYALPRCYQTESACRATTCGGQVNGCAYDTTSCPASSNYPYQCYGDNPPATDGCTAYDANYCPSGSIPTGAVTYDDCGVVYESSRQCMRAQYRVFAFNSEFESEASNVADISQAN